MENKINLVELLKDCPRGMELDCTLYENVEFDYIEQSPESAYPIHCITKTNGGYNALVFTHNGCNDRHPNAKCVIFPKGKTTWEEFIPPCKFKAGDVLYVDCADEESDGDLYKYIFILKEIDNLGNHFSYCHLYRDKLSPCSHYLFDNRYTPRLATEEEKEKLFKAIKDNGYKWNEESKNLEKLPKFKVGDRIKQIGSDRHYIIKNIEFDRYILHNNQFVRFTDEHIYVLVPNKFDINTLKPFDRVLVRLTNNCVWMPKFFSYYDTGSKLKYYPFIITDNIGYPQCIPYEKNEYLSNTTEDCDEYYKTWK